MEIPTVPTLAGVVVPRQERVQLGPQPLIKTARLRLPKAEMEAMGDSIRKAQVRLDQILVEEEVVL